MRVFSGAVESHPDNPETKAAEPGNLKSWEGCEGSGIVAKGGKRVLRIQLRAQQRDQATFECRRGKGWKFLGK